MTGNRQPLNTRITAALGSMVANIRENRKLQLGLVLVAIILCSEALLRWNDHLADQMKSLEETRAELRSLRKQSGNEATLKTTLETLSEARKNIERRLWQIPSEAQGQARMKDWLHTAFKQASVAPINLKIANPRPLAGITTPATFPIPNNPPDLEPPEYLRNLREFRATFGLAFTPENIEKLLKEIEGGQAVAEVETLTIALRDHRAELTVRVLARLPPHTQEKPTAPPSREHHP